MTKKIETPQEILAEMKRLCDAATEGPWKFNASLLMEAMLWIEKWDGRLYLRADKGTAVNDWKMAENTKFISESRTAMPRLIAALERCMEQRDEYLSNPKQYYTDMFPKYQEADNEEITKLLAGE